VGPGVIGVVFLAIALWGLGWGGVATLLQTVVTDAGGERGQALFVTICNSSIAGGSAVGGILLDMLGSGSLPWSAVLLLVPALFIVITASRHAFPALRSRLCVPGSLTQIFRPGPDRSVKLDRG
jgi:predicted MFS family arabinose efflux permease